MTTRPPAPRAPIGPLARLVLVAATLGATAFALLAAGDVLPAPPVTIQPAGWLRWLDLSGPAGAIMAGVRLAALAVTLYLLVIVVLHLASLATGLSNVVVLTRAVSVPWVRRLLQSIAGIGLAASMTAVTTLTTMPAGAVTMDAGLSVTVTATDADAGVPTMRRLDPDPPTFESGPPDTDTARTPTSVTPAEGPAAPTMRRLDADNDTEPPPDPIGPPTTGTQAGPVSELTSGDPPGSAAPPPEAAPTEPPTPPVAWASGPGAETESWTIAPGDHLWGVAARTLAATWHRPPDDLEVARYVSDLIDANRAMLVVPGDADLVFPGQVFTLPPITAP